MTGPAWNVLGALILVPVLAVCLPLRAPAEAGGNPPYVDPSLIPLADTVLRLMAERKK